VIDLSYSLDRPTLNVLISGFAPASNKGMPTSSFSLLRDLRHGQAMVIDWYIGLPHLTDAFN